MTKCPGGCTDHADVFGADTCGILNSAYVLAGLAMMLNIRLSYSSAPYALIRFRLPENLFSVFVRRMASALELWCLPSMLLGNIIDLAQKGVFDNILVTTAAQTLKKAAGTTKDEGTLRGLAETLHTKAEQLHTALSNPGNNDTAAKVLKAKAGNSTDDPKYLRKLAENLYNAANALKSAVGSGDTDVSGLATEVGDTEGSGNKLRDKLRQLASAEASNLHDLKNKAGDVKKPYDTVQGAFIKVKNKAATAYNEGTKKAAYEKVEAAWTDFNAVYRPEELLKEAIGEESAGTGLAEALKALGTDPDNYPEQLKQKVKAVKEKYHNFVSGGVKAAFNKVKAQVDAYAADSNFKTTNYDPLKSAWDAFNNKYHDAISTEKFLITVIPSIISQWLNFLTYVILLFVYVTGGDQGHLTIFYFVIAISGVVFGINMTLVYAVDWQYITVYIAGENCFPALTSFIHYITTLIFGNRRKWNSDFIVVCVDIVVAIIISFAAAVMWTLGYAVFKEGPGGEYGHIHAGGFTKDIHPDHMVSPFLMIVVGMGLVYAIYPGIAPGMIVPFYLIDKIEMVLLIATIFPPMIVVILQITDKNSGFGATKHSPKAWGGWKEHNLRYWHFVDLLMVIKISLAAIFIYSLHYRESSLSRSIINQPKMSTFLSITFYMCHEFLLAIGFAGQISNGPEYVLIPQYIGALFMIFLAFYSEGYIIEYKSNDRANWQTERMWYLYGYYKLNPDCFYYDKV